MLKFEISLVFKGRQNFKKTALRGREKKIVPLPKMIKYTAGMYNVYITLGPYRVYMLLLWAYTYNGFTGCVQYTRRAVCVRDRCRVFMGNILCTFIMSRDIRALQIFGVPKLTVFRPISTNTLGKTMENFEKINLVSPCNNYKKHFSIIILYCIRHFRGRDTIPLRTPGL